MSIFTKHFFYLLLSVSSTLSEFFHWTLFINIIKKIRSNFEKHWLFTVYRVHSNRWACLQASSFMNVLHFATTNWIVCAKNANFEVWTKQLGKTLVWNFYRVVLLEYRITFMKFVENHWNLLYKLIKNTYFIVTFEMMPTFINWSLHVFKQFHDIVHSLLRMLAHANISIKFLYWFAFSKCVWLRTLLITV